MSSIEGELLVDIAAIAVCAGIGLGLFECLLIKHGNSTEGGEFRAKVAGALIGGMVGLILTMAI